MQKKYLSIFALALLGLTASAQDNVYPAAIHKGVTVITHATVRLKMEKLLVWVMLLYQLAPR
jgi:hypothetical protein